MRILHLTPELPFAPGAGGGETREFYLLRRLVELGHDVTNVSPATATQRENAHLLEEAGVTSWFAPRAASQPVEALRGMGTEPALLAAAVARPWLGWQMGVFWSRLRALALEAVERQRPDVVVIGHDMSSAWVRDLPRELPAMLTCHNLMWNYYESRARASGPPASLAFRAEAARYRAYVLRNLPLFHTAIAVSTIERDQLLEIGRTRVEFIPSGVGTDVLRPAPQPVGGPPRVLFTGTMSYLPNHEGIAWFVQNVWPEVRRQVPDALLDVVGRNPPPSVERLGEVEGATVHGAVPEMGPYFADASVVIAPVLTGAGIRIKIIEALAAGRATVSTRLGYEGLELEPGRHLLVADGAHDFAAATVRLLREPELRARLARDGRAVAEQQYDWRALGDRLEEVLRGAVGGG